MLDRWLLIVVFLLNALRGVAQEIGGAIVDFRKEPLVNISVALVQKGVLKATTVTDFDGYFYFRSLDSGSYDLFVYYPGYIVQHTTEVMVCEKGRTRVKFSLDSLRAGGKDTINNVYSKSSADSSRRWVIYGDGIPYIIDRDTVLILDFAVRAKLCFSDASFKSGEKDTGTSKYRKQTADFVTLKPGVYQHKRLSEGGMFSDGNPGNLYVIDGVNLYVIDVYMLPEESVSSRDKAPKHKRRCRWLRRR